MGTGVGVTKLAGKVRSVKPKNITGAVTTDANKWDYVDGTAQSNIDRGQDPTYAMARDAINADLRWLGSPLGRLIGDEFVSATESQINLLADLTALVGTGPLVNNNAVTFALDTSDDESPIWNNTVAQLASASSQYLSVPTASAVQVGTNSYGVGIAFKTSTTGATQMMFSYGSHVAAKAYWEMGINSSNQIFFAQWDATNTDTITDTIANRWQDGRWHIAIAEIDRTNLKAYLSVDGVSIGSVTVTATATLTIAGENLYIGANKSSGASIVNFWNGSLSLFKLVNNAADYNVPLVWNTGQREALSSGTFTAPTNDSNKRLNNKFGTPNTDLAYFYSAIWLEDGEYELQVAYEKGSANGKLDVIMDGNTVISGLDTYNGSTTHNNVSKYYGIKITAGLHTVKIKNNGKNGSSSGNTVTLQWINFIKRKGQEDGGVDNFLLLGDEITERSNETFILPLVDSGQYFDNAIYSNGTAQNGDYVEGTLFIKGGLYYLYITGRTDTDRGKYDLFFGNVQVLNAYDAYAASPANNVIIFNGYVRFNQGRQDIRIAINGKNASSSSYKMHISDIRGTRIAD